MGALEKGHSARHRMALRAKEKEKSGGSGIRSACGFPEFFEELEHQALGVACGGHSVKEILGGS